MTCVHTEKLGKCGVLQQRTLDIGDRGGGGGAKVLLCELQYVSICYLANVLTMVTHLNKALTTLWCVFGFYVLNAVFNVCLHFAVRKVVEDKEEMVVQKKNVATSGKFEMCACVYEFEIRSEETGETLDPGSTVLVQKDGQKFRDSS